MPFYRHTLHNRCTVMAKGKLPVVHWMPTHRHADALQSFWTVHLLLVSASFCRMQPWEFVL